ncbi:Hir1 protein [Martiniozyma asiatica (nom. inval.)]|nr:Hir1 protein [Martiniozyma asiatica]
MEPKLPPRKRARTEEEKEQRRVERILRNRRAAHASREKKRRHVENLEQYVLELEQALLKSIRGDKVTVPTRPDGVSLPELETPADDTFGMDTPPPSTANSEFLLDGESILDEEYTTLFLAGSLRLDEMEQPEQHPAAMHTTLFWLSCVPVYSINSNVDNLLAVGSMDGKITLYDKDSKRELASMSRHDGAITCVKFSHNGRYLASGSDDKLVLIWEKDLEKSTLLNYPHWIVVKRLSAHDNDVQDIDWSPDDSLLISTSLDRSIIIWSTGKFEKIKTLYHESHVKGVSFDPTGKYFTTCSDDHSIRVFHSNGVLESIIKKPFEKSPATTYFRRSSWSPDGSWLCIPNGVNNGIGVNVIIKRGQWDQFTSLVGHRLPCEVCRFSPRLYDVGNGRIDCIVFTAGQDRTLTLWSTNCPTPLAVITELASSAITDISWNENGHEAYICSADGSVVWINFEEGELGRVLDWQEHRNLLAKWGNEDSGNRINESVALMKIRELDKSGNGDKFKELMNAKPAIFTNVEPAKINVLQPRSKKHPDRKIPIILNQKVTITKSGKKRVTPTLLTTTNLTTKSSVTAVKKRKISMLSHPYPALPKHGLPTLVSSIITIPESADDDDNNNNNNNNNSNLKRIVSSLSNDEHEWELYIPSTTLPYAPTAHCTFPKSVVSNTFVHMYHLEAFEIRSNILHTANWQHVFSSPILSISSSKWQNNIYHLIGTQSGEIHVLTNNGRAMLMPWQVGGAVGWVKAKGEWMAAVYEGMLAVWKDGRKYMQTKRLGGDIKIKDDVFEGEKRWDVDLGCWVSTC